MTTITTTTTSTTSFEPLTMGKGMEELCTILEKYKGNTDILSRDIHKWGVESARLYLQNSDSDATTRRGIIDRQMSYLKEEIFTNLFDGMSLLDGKDGMPQRHYFGLEMVDWAYNVNSSLDSEGSQELVKSLPNTVSARVRSLMYKRLAKDAMAVRAHKDFQEQMRLATRSMQMQKYESGMESELVLAEAHDRTANHETQLAIKFSAVEASYESRIEGFQQQVTVVKEEFRRDKAALEAQIVAEHNASSAMAEQLRASMVAREQKFQRDIQGLNQQMDHLIVAQKATENRLQAAASAAESRSQQLATQVVTTEAKMESVLAECSHLKNEVNAEKQLTEAQARQMADMQREQARQIEEVKRQKIKDSRRCVIS